MSNRNDDDNPDGHEQLPVPRREFQTLTRSDKSSALISTLAEAFKNHGTKDVSDAIVKIATQTDIELVRERNRVQELEYKYRAEQLLLGYKREVKQQKAQLETEQLREVARLEQSKIRLRYVGLWAAVLLSLVNGVGAVLLVIYGHALVGLLFALCLGLAALSAACAGAAFAIATGVAVKPKDFSNMLTAARTTMGGSDDIETNTP